MRKKSIIIGTFLLIIDQLVKILVNSTVRYGVIKPIIPNFFYLTKVYNNGAAWSMFDGSVMVLIIIALLSLVCLIYYQKYFKNNYLTIMTFSFVYGGLLGNLVDRLIYGHVIDYFKLVFGNYSFPIFNLADIFIVCGFIILIYKVIKGEDKNADISK